MFTQKASKSRRDHSSLAILSPSTSDHSWGQDAGLHRPLLKLGVNEAQQELDCLWFASQALGVNNEIRCKGFISVSQFPNYSSILSNLLSLKIKKNLDQEKKKVKNIYKDQVLQTYLMHKFFVIYVPRSLYFINNCVAEVCSSKSDKHKSASWTAEDMLLN